MTLLMIVMVRRMIAKTISTEAVENILAEKYPTASEFVWNHVEKTVKFFYDNTVEQKQHATIDCAAQAMANRMAQLENQIAIQSIQSDAITNFFKNVLRGNVNG
jgi:hypothetical protein